MQLDASEVAGLFQGEGVEDKVGEDSLVKAKENLVEAKEELAKANKGAKVADLEEGTAFRTASGRG